MAEGEIPTTVPAESQSPDLAIAANFERFDGLGQPPLENPATASESSQLGAVYGTNGPRPGGLDQPTGQTYTEGALVGVVGTIGGAPLPVQDWKYHHGDFTAAVSPGIQFRMGVGQRGPSELGAAQTTALGGITSNPPEPGSLANIIAGVG